MLGRMDENEGRKEGRKRGVKRGREGGSNAHQLNQY